MLEEGYQLVSSPGGGEGGEGEGPRSVQAKGGETGTFHEEKRRGLREQITEATEGVSAGFSETAMVT